MKKIVAFLMCFMMVLSLFSCRTNDQKGKDPVNTNDTPPSSSEIAKQMYESAIHDEICVFDERAGEVKLKDLRFASNNTTLEACKLLKKAILDIDQDGVNEYVIQSPNHEYIILRCYNGKVYSYWLDASDYYKFNTDGTFYWCNSPHSAEMACGLNEIVFDREALNVKPLYSLQYSNHPDEYFVEGEVVTEREYYDYRNSIHKSRESMKFSQFELMCSYPITAEQAWNLANAYWDNQEGRSDGSAGSVYTARIVLIDTPNSETEYYRVAFQVEKNTGGGLEGYECIPPSSIRIYDQILVNAFTGEITTPACEAGGKAISIEEAIEIVKNHGGYVSNKYRVEHDVDATAPDHIYVIVIYEVVNQHDRFYTRYWVDKYTGEIVFGYYMFGK